MSIASEITRINNNIASAYSQCQSKGATMPATQNSANLANTISTISGGGGVDINDYFNTTIDSVSTDSNTFGKNIIKKIPRLTIASGITSLAYAFYNFQTPNLAFEGIDCTGITNMQYAFGSYTTYFRQKTIDFANWTNTTNITYLRDIFHGQQELESVSNMFSVVGTSSNKIDLRAAFYDCRAIKIIDLSSLSGICSSLYTCFSSTYKATIIDISNLEFISNTTLSSAFNNCGTQCLQSDGAYADGIPYVYVRSSAEQSKILEYAPSTWSTNNVVIKSS